MANARPLLPNVVVNNNNCRIGQALSCPQVRRPRPQAAPAPPATTSRLQRLAASLPSRTRQQQLERRLSELQRGNVIKRPPQTAAQAAAAAETPKLPNCLQKRKLLTTGRPGQTKELTLAELRGSRDLTRRRMERSSQLARALVTAKTDQSRRFQHALQAQQQAAAMSRRVRTSAGP